MRGAVSWDELPDLCASLALEEAIGLDLETTGLSPRDSRIRLVQLSDGSESFVLDAYDLPLRKGAEAVRKALRPLSWLLGSDPVIKVAQNAKFDLSFLKWEFGIGVRPVFDTMIAGHLLGLRGSASLEDLALLYLDEVLPKGEQRSDWSKSSLTESQIEYAAKDALVLPALRERMKEDLERNGLGNAARIEFGCIPAVVSMELNGMGLDLDHVAALAKRTASKARIARAAFEEHLREADPRAEQMNLLGFDPEPRINLSSPKQVRQAFASMGVQTPDGTAERELKKIDHPAAKVLLEHRKHSKRLASFLEPLPKLVHPKTGRIHPTFNQSTVRTGRFSSSAPNVQQIPREQEFRDCFVAGEGRTIVSADYSGQELRVLAELSGDKAMRKAFCEYVDLHTFSASKMFGVGEGEVTKDQRNKAKTASFGLLYGAGPKQIAFQLGSDEKEAREVIDTYLDTYPQVKRWIASQGRTGASGKFVRTMSGRKVPLTEGDENRRKREAVNYQIQGCSADMTKLALMYIEDGLRDCGGDGRLISCVHDEVLVECDAEWEEEVSLVVTEGMVRAGRVFVKSVPVEVEASASERWTK